MKQGRTWLSKMVTANRLVLSATLALALALSLALALALTLSLVNFANVAHCTSAAAASSSWSSL